MFRVAIEESVASGRSLTVCAGELCGRLALERLRPIQSNASVQPKKSVMSLRLGQRFKKTDGEAREGGAVENLSEEFDPGSD